MTPIIFQRRAQIAVSGPSGSSFATPNLANNLSFETDFSTFTNFSLDGNPPGGTTRDNTLAAPGGGSWSLLRTLAPNPGGDVGSDTAFQLSASATRLWVRFYFNLTTRITSTWKWHRFYTNGFGDAMGGLWINSGSDIIGWGWDVEDQSIVTTIGLSQAQVIDGNWHSIEADYWRFGDPSGFPSAQFWFDGNEQYLADGTPTKFFGAGNNGFWLNKRLNAGERGTPPTAGVSNAPIRTIEWLGTLNGGNTTTGQCNVDLVSYSSLGRIGP